MSDEISLNHCYPDTVECMRKAQEKVKGDPHAEFQWYLVAALCSELASLREDMNHSAAQLTLVVSDANKMIHEGLTKGWGHE